MIFVDTSFWVAFRNRDDEHQVEAARLAERCAERGLLTTNLVRGETWTFLRRRVGHPAALQFLDSTERSGRLSVYVVGPDLEATAWRWLRRHDERAYSFVDATSFAAMRELGIEEALAFDEDFAAAGFRQPQP